MKRRTTDNCKRVLGVLTILVMMPPTSAFASPAKHSNIGNQIQYSEKITAQSASATTEEPTPSTEVTPSTSVTKTEVSPQKTSPNLTVSKTTGESTQKARKSSTESQATPTVASNLFDSTTQEELAPSSESKDWQLFFGGQLGIGQIDSDFYFNVQPFIGGYALLPGLFCPKATPDCQAPLAGKLNLSVQIILYDAPPTVSRQFLRHADWDQPSEYIRFIDQLSYGKRNQAFYLNIGAFDRLTLGHGTMVDNFSNTVDTAHRPIGMELSLNLEPIGGTLFIDDVFSPNLAGLNVYVRPFAFKNNPLFLKRIALGATLLTQIQAPVKLDIQNDRIQIDEYGLPKVAQRTTGIMFGFDAELTSVETETFALIHYIDINTLSLKFGIHIGTELGYQITEGHDIDVRVELQALGQGYIPSYVSPLFEYSQYIDQGWGSKTVMPLYALLEQNQDNGIGTLIALSYQYGDFATIGAIYQLSYGDTNSRLTLSVQLHPEDWGQLGIFYFSGNGNPGEVFNISAGGLLAMEARAKIFGPLYGYGSYRHRLDYGYAPGGNNILRNHINDWSLGVGVNFEM